MADMENALWGADRVKSDEPLIDHSFVTAMIKGEMLPRSRRDLGEISRALVSRRGCAARPGRAVSRPHLSAISRRPPCDLSAISLLVLHLWPADVLVGVPLEAHLAEPHLQLLEAA